jgi:hypothetical protein
MLGGGSETFGDKAKIAYLGKQESSNMNSKNLRLRTTHLMVKCKHGGHNFLLMETIDI